MKLVLFANTDWYLYNFRRSLAVALRDAEHEVVLVSPSGPYGGKLRAMGLVWLPAPMARRGLNPVRELALVWWLGRLLKRERADVIHGFTIKCAVYGAFAGRLAGVKTRVGAIAGLGYVFTSDEVRARLLRPLVRLLLRLALGGSGSKLILQNRDDLRVFESSGLAGKAKVWVIPGSGVDCSRFQPHRALSSASTVADGVFRVLLAARLLRDKGLEEYAEAARILKGEQRNIVFLLAGEPDPGNPASVSVATVQDWAAAGIVEWLGHVDDMPALLHSVDAVVLPSYREGLPKALIEAAACALPLVTTDVPGCREVVADNVDGLLVPVKDARALAGAIAKLHDDRQLRIRLGNAARNKALAEFDERIIIARTVAVYSDPPN